LLANPEDGVRRILLVDFGIVRQRGDISGLAATNLPPASRITPRARPAGIATSTSLPPSVPLTVLRRPHDQEYGGIDSQ
jgi:hypothetical protein